MSAAQRPVALVVAALLVLGAVVVGVNVLGDRGKTAGSASPSATASASASDAPTDGASADPSAPSDEETLAILAEIEQQVEAIRGLEPADIGPAELITREQLGVELRQIFDEEYPLEDRERDNIVLLAFGLLEPGQDVAELQLELLGEGVLGFYDDIEKRMVVVTDAGLDATAKVTYAHEYTHALQDAAFGLDSLETDAVGEDDRGLARTALIEGDASTTMLAWAFRHMTQAEILELQEMPIPDTSNIPSWMVAQIEFPYLDGQTWVTELAGNPFAPDFTAVDAAYVDPPSSTEQVIHFEKWDSREEPIPVELPDLATALGAGWEEIDATPVGEASIRIVLEHFGVDAPVAAAAAEGWGGDRSLVVASDDGDVALVWRLVWDGPADGAEFAQAYEAVVAALPFPASVRELPDGSVLVVHASTQALHDATLGSVECVGC
ncbi:MAG: hypothetical protein ACXWWL_06050 [Candidatus Limnocylindria bacterium]